MKILHAVLHLKEEKKSIQYNYVFKQNLKRVSAFRFRIADMETWFIYKYYNTG